MAATAVVFAYHDVGVRCLSALLAHGVKVPLVVTYRDDPKETVWFGSVEGLAREHGLATAVPEDPADIASRGWGWVYAVGGTGSTTESAGVASSSSPSRKRLKSSSFSSRDSERIISTAGFGGTLATSDCSGLP